MMNLYYFDLRDGDYFLSDEEGLELRDILAAQEEAARALEGLSWDAVRKFKGTQNHKMTIEVRDRLGPLMQVMFSFEIVRIGRSAVW